MSETGREAEGDPPEREFEELLRRATPPRPDALFREQARQAFLANTAGGASRAPRGSRMGTVVDAAHEDEFTAWLAAYAPVDQPRTEFRHKVRASFLSAAATAPPARVRPPRALQIVVLSLAAAAILAVTFLLPEPERWHVRMDGPLELAGVPYAPGDEDRLAVELEGAGKIETSTERARFAFGPGEMVVVETLPGTVLNFPSLPVLDGASTIAFDLERGEAYLHTGAGYPGNPIVIRTPQAEVNLHGTTLGVLVCGEGTCVCVADGTVEVASDHLANWHENVSTRSTLFVHSDRGTESQTVSFPAEGEEDAHVRGLVEFFDAP